MNEGLIQKKFNDMGVDISFTDTDRRPPRFRDNQLVSIDVVQDKKVERFFLGILTILQLKSWTFSRIYHISFREITKGKSCFITNSVVVQGCTTQLCSYVPSRSGTIEVI